AGPVAGVDAGTLHLPAGLVVALVGRLGRGGEHRAHRRGNEGTLQVLRIHVETSFSWLSCMACARVARRKPMGTPGLRTITRRRYGQPQQGGCLRRTVLKNPALPSGAPASSPAFNARRHPGCRVATTLGRSRWSSSTRARPAQGVRPTRLRNRTQPSVHSTATSANARHRARVVLPP